MRENKDDLPDAKSERHPVAAGCRPRDPIHQILWKTDVRGAAMGTTVNPDDRNEEANPDHGSEDHEDLGASHGKHSVVIAYLRAGAGVLTAIGTIIAVVINR